MESAIDKHMQCPRHLSRRVGDDYVPPFPMYVGRMNPDISQIGMGFFGIQYMDESLKEAALAEMTVLREHLRLENGTDATNLVRYKDELGYTNLIVLAYWKSGKQLCDWLQRAEIAAWWSDEARDGRALGYFREILTPMATHVESLYQSSDLYPGMGNLMEGSSGEIVEHGYWGSARDRIPASQVDRMSAQGRLVRREGRPDTLRRVVEGHDNIALIRSGQDWRSAVGEEREVFLREMLPTLQAGMDFLRDEGQSIGCYSSRFVTEIDSQGNPLESTFNLSYWRSLDRLERWSESHPTHLRIFTTFFRIADKLMNLKFHHEVSVIAAQFQRYEYINCHANTGLLRDTVLESADQVASATKCPIA